MPVRSICLLLMCLVGHAVAGEVQYLGTRRLPALPELSGLAASRVQPGHWWALNDSGNPAELVLLSPELRQRGRVPVVGGGNHDWEDLASFEWQGRAWLLVGDIGNNFGFRAEGQLLLIPEPGPGDAEAHVERTLRYRFEDGARDCEALAVDVTAGQILLADKGRRPVGLYALPLEGGDGVITARRIADFPELVPTPPPKVMGLAARRGRGTATAMDVSADGTRLAVLTYLSMSLFERRPGQGWAQALAQPSLSLRLPRKTGFEAMALDPEGNVLIGGEGVPARFAFWRQP